MHQRYFGRDHIPVSQVGLGTWQLGGDWGTMTDDKAADILRTAVENNITFYDTADVYGLGQSEKRLREWLPDRDDLFIATKIGRRPEPGGTENYTLDTLRAHTEDSLRHLGVDALDLTQLHCLPIEEYRRGDIFDHLRTLKQEGKIKRFGASVESMEEALICLEQDGLYALQIIFNIFRQKPIHTLFEKAKEKEVALIVRLPLASGLLAGKFDKDSTFSEEDHRHYNKDGEAFNVGETFAGLPFEKGVELVEQIKPWVPAGYTMAQMAIRWVLDFDAVSVVIPGASKPAQVVGNAAAADLPPLSAELHQKLADFYEAKVVDHIRGPY